MRRTRELLFQTDTLKLELLNTPIHQLDLKFEGTIFAQAIPVVKEELRRAGIRKLEPRKGWCFRGRCGSRSSRLVLRSGNGEHLPSVIHGSGAPVRWFSYSGRARFAGGILRDATRLQLRSYLDGVR